MRANDCKPLALEAASPPSLQMDANTTANTNALSSCSSLVPFAFLTPKEAVLKRVSVTLEQSMAIEAKTRGYSAWYEEH